MVVSRLPQFSCSFFNACWIGEDWPTFLFLSAYLTLCLFVCLCGCAVDRISKRSQPWGGFRAASVSAEGRQGFGGYLLHRTDTKGQRSAISVRSHRRAHPAPWPLCLSFTFVSAPSCSPGSSRAISRRVLGSCRSGVWLWSVWALRTSMFLAPINIGQCGVCLFWSGRSGWILALPTHLIPVSPVSVSGVLWLEGG